MIIVTWNMQGVNANWENKWNSCVMGFFTEGNADAVCLQECGALPPSVENNVAQVFAVPNPVNPAGPNINVTCYRWGTARVAKFITFYPWDVLGNRCNLAVVTTAVPTQVWLLMGAGPAQWRPVLGVQTGGEQIFSIHAISPGGADAPPLIQAVQGLALPSFHVLGDYNTPPDTLTPKLPAGAAVSTTAANTYSTATPQPTVRYDYAVTSAADGAQASDVLSLVFSDHYPARFQFA